MELKVEHHAREGRGKWTVTHPEKADVVAEMTYIRPKPDLMIIDHTGVPEEFKGMGIGKQLLAEAVRMAREEKIFIVPTCPFAKAQLFKHKEMHDVLDPSVRP